MIDLNAALDKYEFCMVHEPDGTWTVFQRSGNTPRCHASYVECWDIVIAYLNRVELEHTEEIDGRIYFWRKYNPEQEMRSLLAFFLSSRTAFDVGVRRMAFQTLKKAYGDQLPGQTLEEHESIRDQEFEAAWKAIVANFK